jgi:8-oxo-dGTP diphosphatase
VNAPIRVVAGVLVRDGRVLAARRGPGRPLAGYWEFPGGKVEDGETDPAALQRELAEELALQVQVGGLVAESLWTGGTKPILLVAYACQIEAGAEPSGTDHDAFLWVQSDAIADLGWAPADVPLLPAVLSELSKEQP